MTNLAVDEALDRAAAWEPRIHAFAWLDPARIREAAARVRPGPLDGLPVAVKDIFDTRGVPTEHGSALFRGRVPEESAAAVLALEEAGGVVFGKTVTAELAYFTPGPTLNPWNLGRTPGGSSMGSAAAVAAGIVTAAIGSQTNGSVIRPAAFCGVVGFKPTAGLIPTAGVLEFSRTLDQVGSFGAGVEAGALVAWVMAGRPGTAWGATGLSAPPRFGAVRTKDWEMAEQALRERFEADLELLAAAGATVEQAVLPRALDDAVPIHRRIMAAEASGALGKEVARAPQLVSDALKTLLEEGARVTPEELAAALAERERLIAVFEELAAPYDALLTPPTLGEAPPADTTGDPRFCTRWTLVGAPALVLPSGFGPQGLPLGLQLVAGRGRDRELAGVARWAERSLRLRWRAAGSAVTA